MRKIQFLAIFWTLLIAIPFTALALSLSAYLTEHLVDIATGLSTIDIATTIGGRGWAMEISQRWPELVGMIVGQLVILTILLLSRWDKTVKDKEPR